MYGDDAAAVTGGTQFHRAAALVIQARHGSYSWKNTGVSTLVAVGRLISQAALHGGIIGIIAVGVHAVRLTTIPVSFHNWPSLVALFLLTDIAFYVEHRCSHRIRLMWASHSVHHSTDRMVTSAAFRLAWTPILSGVVSFYLPIVWMRRTLDQSLVVRITAFAGMTIIRFTYQFESLYSAATACGSAAGVERATFRPWIQVCRRAR